MLGWGSRFGLQTLPATPGCFSATFMLVEVDVEVEVTIVFLPLPILHCTAVVTGGALSLLGQSLTVSTFFLCELSAH